MRILHVTNWVFASLGAVLFAIQAANIAINGYEDIIQVLVSGVAFVLTTGPATVGALILIAFKNHIVSALLCLLLAWLPAIVLFLLAVHALGRPL